MYRQSVTRLVILIVFYSSWGSMQDVWFIDGHETMQEPMDLGNVVLVGDASLEVLHFSI